MILFEGDDVLVNYEPASEDKSSIFLTFTARDGTLKNRSGFGRQLFEAHQRPSIHFIAKKNIWWQTSEMIAATKAAAAIRSDYRRAVTYGSSMGAFGALLFSSLLDATDVLALAPQFSVNGRKAPWPEFWIDDTKDIEEIYLMEDQISRSADISIAYDPLCALDSIHVREIEKIRPIRKIITPMAGHGVARTLAEMGILRDLALNAGSTQPDAISTRRLYKSKRRGSLHYLVGLAVQASTRRKDSVARYADTQIDVALKDVITNGKIRDEIIISSCLLNTAKNHPPEDIEKLCLAFIERCPEKPLPLVTLAKIYRGQGRFREALPLATSALSLFRKDSTTRIIRATILANLKRTDLAESEIRFCLTARRPVPAKVWKESVYFLKNTDVWPRVSDDVIAVL